MIYVLLLSTRGSKKICHLAKRVLFYYVYSLNPNVVPILVALYLTVNGNYHVSIMLFFDNSTNVLSKKRKLVIGFSQVN